MRLLFLFGSLLGAAIAVAQTLKSSDVADFVSVNIPVFALNHVRVIDGTGAAAKEDQTLVIANGKIQSIRPAASAQIPQGAQLLDRSAIQSFLGSLECGIISTIQIRSPCKLLAEESASQGCLLRKSLTQRRDCI